MFNCEFINNGIHALGGVSASGEGEFVVESCTFAGNVGLPIEHSRGRMIVSNCLFAGNKGGFFSSGIHSWAEYVTIRNCTFSGNSSIVGGGALHLSRGGKLNNCLFWGNDSPAIDARRDELWVNYCNIEGGWPGEGITDVDPCFVEPGYWDTNGTPQDANDDFWVHGDYHLRSQAGRWDPETRTWVLDDVTSPCIDAGDPNAAIGVEPFPNGGRLNMGAYGAAETASKSYFGRPPCDVIIAGDINGDCIVDSLDLAILESHWLMRPEDLVNKFPTVTVIEPQDGAQVAWPGPTVFRAQAGDVDGEVRRVRFILERRTGNRTIGTGFTGKKSDIGWEYEFTWSSSLPSGTWTVWAEATDDKGDVGTSPEITITLYRP